MYTYRDPPGVLASWQRESRHHNTHNIVKYMLANHGYKRIRFASGQSIDILQVVLR